jgi:hypothetical protein
MKFTELSKIFDKYYSNQVFFTNNDGSILDLFATKDMPYFLDFKEKSNEII